MSPVADFAEAFLQVHLTNTLSSANRFDIGALTLEDAYEVQRRVIAARVARGEQVVGYTVSCTSRPIREQLGLAEPIFGRLMAPYVHYGDSELDCGDFVHCAVTPAFVLRIRSDIGSEVEHEHDLGAAIEWVAAGIEVHHYRFWFGKPTLQELIAANGLHAVLVVGEKKLPASEVELELEGVGMFRSDELLASGIGAEILGGPLKSLRWLTNQLVRRGEHPKAGQLVIPGSAVPLAQAEPGDTLTAAFTRLGRVSVKFRG